MHVTESDRGRPESVTADDLFDHLQRSREPCTVNDFAETFDVTAKTVRKRLDELERYPGVGSKKAANATVYWYSTPKRREDKQFGSEDVAQLPSANIDAEDYREAIREDRAKARGLWLSKREFHAARRGVGGGDVQSVYERAALWNSLHEYMDSMLFTTRVFMISDLQESGIDDAGEVDLERWAIDERRFDYYTKQVELYDGVEGLEEFARVARDKSDELAEEYKKPEDDISVERLDSILPSYEALLHAGDVFDEFVCEMLGYNW